MSELMKRILTASVLMPLAIGWLLYMPSPWFDWILAFLAFLASIELFQLLEISNRMAFSLSVAAIWAMLVLGVQPMIVLIFLSFVWLFLSGLGIPDLGLRERFRQLAFAQWMFIWLFLCVWMILILHKDSNGHFFIAAACAGIWAADIGAYFVGKKLGSHKLCPQISPGKTIEGFTAAFIAGMPVAAILWIWLTPMPFYQAIPLAFVLVMAGAIGDLAESALKRCVGAKDSSSLLPGHGGILDRVDALIVALPVSGMLWMAV